MRRAWIFIGLGVAVIGAIVAYQRFGNWKEYKFSGARLMIDLAQPDALIRTGSLSVLPRDLLKVPIAQAVLTEDLAFYYEQHEDRLGLNGAIKRIAYEHNLDWSDRIVQSVFNEPADIAFWRDGKGALRHYAIVMRRNALGKVLQEAATAALKDGQLAHAGELELGGGFGRGSATMLALTLNPRRTLLLISKGDRIVVLSDPGMLFDADNQVGKEGRAALANWLGKEGSLALQFGLDRDLPHVAGKDGKATVSHTFAIGAPTLALGYGAFVPGIKGLRFDFGGTWSTAVWLDPAQIPAAGLGDGALWRAAPANPSACVLLPVDWRMARAVVDEAEKPPQLPGMAVAVASSSSPASSSAGTPAATAPVAASAALASLDGAALACWYGESSLYSPVFIARLRHTLPQRDATLQALAAWAITSGGTMDGQEGGKDAGKDGTMLWHANDSQAALGARGDYVVFSPDASLVAKVLDTIGRTNPSVADQIPASNLTLGLITPRPLSAMASKEIMEALGNSGEDNLLTAAQTHLPARMQALAAFPQYRLELNEAGKAGKSARWQTVEWRSEGKK
jgi:uncharacterized protein YfaA (DUF2138 family)